MPVQPIEPLFLLAAVPIEQAATVFLGGGLTAYGIWKALRGDILRKDANNEKAWEAVNGVNETAHGLIQSSEKMVALLALTTAEHRSQLAAVLSEARQLRTDVARLSRQLDDMRGRDAVG